MTRAQLLVTEADYLRLPCVRGVRTSGPGQVDIYCDTRISPATAVWLREHVATHKLMNVKVTALPDRRVADRRRTRLR